MRLVYFSQDYSPHDHRFLQALAGSAEEVFYLRLEGRGVRLETRPLPGGVRGIDWWGGRRRVRWWQFPRARRELGEVLERLRPDLVHAGPIHGPALLTAWGNYRPLVSMSWGSDLLVDARAGLGHWTARRVLSRSDALICDSVAVQEQAERLGMRAEAIVRFPWGVDLQHFSPGPAGELRTALGWDSEFVALSTRAWERLQGVDVLVRGFIAAARALPELRLLMLASGSLEADIRRQLEGAGLTDRVHFAGQVGFEELPRYYRTADLYLSASRSDGSSISLLEAMACGLPALVSDIPGNREWVQPGHNGWLFKDGDEQGMAAALRAAVARRDGLAQAGEAARRLAEERANWDTNSQGLWTAYALALQAESAR